MGGRPEILYPLFAGLDSLDGVGSKTAGSFARIGVEKPRDLLFVLPRSVVDRRRRETVLDVDCPATATVEVEIVRHQPPSEKGRPWRIEVRDARTTFQLRYFNTKGDWLERKLPEGSRRVVSGKLEIFGGVLQMVHPDHVLNLDEASEFPDFEPVYPMTEGLKRSTVAKAVTSALDRVPKLDEWIDPALRDREGWPAWDEAIQAAHSPRGVDDLESTASARRRLAYDELMAHQLTLALRVKLGKGKGVSNRGNGALRRKVLDALPYPPTGAQKRAIEEIVADMAGRSRMYRLLQGDVGSGKTLVAFMALLAAAEAGGQGALMAPTDILARQHLDWLRPLAEEAGVAVETLTGRDKGKRRDAKLAALASGETQLLVGTHALFQSDVKFLDLRLAVVDEQHRFGVAQRMELGFKGLAADMLTMTATPIPRSLSLALYGDMDVSVLDEKPPGRTPVKTSMVSTARLDETVGHLRGAVAKGRQAYWVCALVEENETIDLTAAEDRFAHLRSALGDDIVDMIHGRMKSAEKDAAMERFANGGTRVLVSTSVVEVGVDVPGASIMVVEQAERFGLAQLHQLRGRIGRGSEESTCLLLYTPPLGESGRRKLMILRETEDGFRIAEEDLAIRGAGDLIGSAQSGAPRFNIADIETQSALMELARTDARKLLVDDPDLESERGRAARTLLWMMEQDRAIRMIRAG